jgi:hypothetical protein
MIYQTRTKTTNHVFLSTTIKQVKKKSKLDGFVKSPHAALCRILCHCSVRQVRFIPQDLHALPANFLRSHQTSKSIFQTKHYRKNLIELKNSMFNAIHNNGAAYIPYTKNPVFHPSAAENRIVCYLRKISNMTAS